MVSFTYHRKFRSSSLSISQVPFDVQHLTIEDSVDYLPDGMCQERQALSQVDFASRLRLIGDRSFHLCSSLRQVAMPCRLISIGEAAFRECALLTEVFLNAGLQTIGIQSFSMCPNLRRIQVPSSVETIEKSAFAQCHGLVEVILSEGLMHIEERAFYECCLLREIMFPETIETVGQSAFSACKSLVDIGLPSKCQLMSFAFADCSSLVQIEISSSIGTLPEAGFLGCSSLADVRLREGLQRIGDFSFAGATSLVKVELPASTTVIGLYAFAGCVSLKEMHISEGLIEVGTRSFAACVSLSGIRVPSTVKKIGLFAFSECTNLVSVEFAPAIQGPLSIEASAFHNCKSLMNIELLQKINIHENALDGCDSLQCVFGDHRLAVLSMRFQSEPLHQCCYHSFDTTVDEVRLHLYYDPEKWIDDDNVLDLAFGMTPFHVLLSAASRRLDLLELLLQTYPPFVLDCKDRFGRRAIEYLTFIWNEETRALMEAYLQKWLIDQLEGCLVNDWLSDMTQRVTCILEEEDQENRDCLIRDACCTMKRYERVETLSLLELALWKKDMVSGDDVNGAPLPSSDREAHRAKCGATFLVPNVIAFMESVEW